MYIVVKKLQRKTAVRARRARCMHADALRAKLRRRPPPSPSPRPRFVQDRSLGDLADHSAGDGAGDDLPEDDLTGDRLLLRGLVLLLPL